MAKTLYKYEASSNKFVWFTTWDRALIIPMIIIMYLILSLVILIIRLSSLDPESPVWLMWIGGMG